MNKDILAEIASPKQLKHWEEVQKHQSVTKAAEVLKVNRRTLQRSVEQLKKKLAAAGYQPERGLTHQTASGFTTKRVSTMYGTDGEIKAQWHIQQPEHVTLKEQLEDIKNALCDELPKYKPTKSPTNADAQLMNAIVIGDPHLDMLAYDREVGKNWDSIIAEQQHAMAIENLIDRAPKAAIGALYIMGDSLHRDSMKALTPGSGNLVDVDGRVSRSIDTAVRLFRRAVDKMLARHDQVIVCWIRGNHSETLELAMSKMLDIVYENEPRVAVLDNTSKHIPYRFGANFLLATHGDRLSDQRKADIAVGHFREHHGAAKFTHVLCGHVHHASQKEISGCLVETFQALPTPDAWHFESGYVTSDQSVSLLTYHTAGGIVSRLTEFPRIFMPQLCKK